ncbi:putative ABC phosphate/phosphonate transporter, periplasmic ligand binding protein [Methylocella silvestris BL2]|uniref:Putative ABC phosphate/phosphonate transporter, periplasmic ligand binding protein n=1 Tax=Methylocella silvestris (strain DSM 15510 / CIP 108128 / LMG 27833 / NCIMB 13906 / BL2) TaxID=395965 RepID=B8ETA5_METSB|nr:PhnD/SsuA/transferrin family substrate-binding protein [Methylocella silvestris]ACK51747.1 putative ABC phosphate/phosphonate transporter, periplasmic ligand binding protein [Methylocella silvestris BL2]
MGARKIAAFPMYDLPQLASATDAFWGAIAKRLEDAGLTGVPISLTRSEDYAATWRDPRLLLGQACGYPLMKRFRNAARIVATPLYTSPGCESWSHCSVFITNAKAGRPTLDALRGSVCAVNGFDSNTGMNLLRAAIAPLAGKRAFFHSVVVTGSHLASLEAVADGRADLAAIDCVSFAHFQHFEPALARRVTQIGRSTRTAAPPFITARETDDAVVEILRGALNDVAADPELDSVRAALVIGGFEVLSEADYEFALRIEKDAATEGYPDLR